MNRIVCLGRQPQTAAELRAIAAKELGVSPEAGPPHAILWPGGSGQRPGPLELKSFERQFANIVDAIAALPRPEGALQSRQWGQIAPIPRTERKAEILFWRMLKIQIALMSVNLALGLVVGLGISDPDTRSIAMFAVSAPFTLFNMWLLLQNWLVYIYDVGIPSDRWKASVALAFTIFVSVFSIAFGSSRMEATPQAPAPRPLAPQVVEADQRLLAAEDQAEAEYQRDFGRR
jgi:hypothetical protein